MSTGHFIFHSSDQGYRQGAASQRLFRGRMATEGAVSGGDRKHQALDAAITFAVEGLMSIVHAEKSHHGSGKHSPSPSKVDLRTPER